jgi:hypothetical protein
MYIITDMKKDIGKSMKSLIVKNGKLPETIDFTPTLAFTFYSERNRESFIKLADEIEQRFHGISLVGCSSGGNISGTLPFLTDNIVIMLMEIEPTAFTLEFLTEKQETLALTEEWKTKKKSALLFYAQYSSWLENHFETVRNCLDEGAFYGAIAGAPLHGSATVQGSVYYKKRFHVEGAVCCIFDAGLYTLNSTSLHNFEPAGIEFTVTSANGHEITHIEDEAALDALEQIIGTLTPEKIESFNAPLFIDNGDSDQSDFQALASLWDFDREKKTLSMLRKVYSGTKFKAAIPVSRTTLIQRFENFHERVKTADDGIALLFVCVAMRSHWGRIEPLRIMDVARHLDIPFAGLHTLGSVVPSNTEHESVLQNQVLGIVTLTERRNHQ